MLTPPLSTPIFSFLLANDASEMGDGADVPPSNPPFPVEVRRHSFWVPYTIFLPTPGISSPRMGGMCHYHLCGLMG